MATTSTKKKSIDDGAQDPRGRIATFAQLRSLVREDRSFEGFSLSVEDEETISLQKDGLTKIVLAPEIWVSSERRGPYFERADAEDIVLICFGNADDLAKHVPDTNDRIQAIAAPLSYPNFQAMINNIHFLQTHLKNESQARESVAETNEHIKHILSISRALNGERDIPRLLNLILKKARQVTSADAGSIYRVDYDKRGSVKDGTIHFSFTQNDSIEQNLSAFSMPVSEGSIVGNAVIHGVSINIPDLYKLDEDPEKNPYGWVHDRRWDQQTGYECHSMLTVPIYNISYQIIGVVQLINRKRDPNTTLRKPMDFEDQVLPFAATDQEYAEIVAQQAGIALENAQLAKDKEDLFEGFVHASVTAIEQRDPSTSGHSHRVAQLTCGMAEILDKMETGPFRNTHFTDDEMKEIEYASLLHDFGKLGVSENVLLKAKKLYNSQLDLIKERFEHIRATIEISHLRKRLQFLQMPAATPFGLNVDQVEQDHRQKLEDLDNVMRFIEAVNEPSVLEQGGFERLTDIANYQFEDARGNKRSFLNTSELAALSVSRGSLTTEEFMEIQSHVNHTYEFLRKIPWGENLANIPQIAAKHHEKIDGSGYPTGAVGTEIPVQTRIMTISDIFDALTASDRPYKKAVPAERALTILEMEVKAGKCDPKLYQIFCESEIYRSVLKPG